MTYGILYDTGYGNAAMTGNQVPYTQRAGVNPAEDNVFGFGIDITVETINGGGSVQNDDEIRNDTSLSTVSPITFKNPAVVINCTIPQEAVDNTNYKHSWLYQLIQMERTKGVKILALKGTGTIDFNGTATTNSNFVTITDGNGLYADDELIGKYLTFTSGDNEGIERVIIDNDQTDIALDPAVPNQIKTGDSYVIYDKPFNYVYNRLETLPEMYGRRYLDEPSKVIVASLTGQTEGTTPHLVGYVENVSNVMNSSKDDHIRFTITFRLIEAL